MYQILLPLHSYIRYIVIILLLAVIIKSFLGMSGKKPYEKIDNQLSLSLFIFTHTQLLVGLILYLISPFVKFGAITMKDAITRYWTVEHLVGMLIAVVLITMARITAKKMTDHTAKHKRMFVFNSIALVIIVIMILLSDRDLV
ncbi:MAG: hypothetical protein ABJA70_23860 [Chryseolinea sp.]